MAGIGFFNNNNKALMKNAFKINKLDNLYKKNKEMLQKSSEPEAFFRLLEEAYATCEKMQILSTEINLYIGVDAAEKMVQELDSNKTEWTNRMIDRAVAEHGITEILQRIEAYRHLMTNEGDLYLQQIADRETQKTVSDSAVTFG